MFGYAALALFGAAVAQAQTQATALDIAAVQAHFTQAQIAGQPTYMLPTFTPQGTLGLTFGSSSISIGQKVDQSNANSSPQIAVVPASNGSRINAQSIYTVAMVDADIVGTNAQTTPLTRHWLVNNVMLQGSGSYSINYTGSVGVTDYAGPGPAAGSGSHRYVVLLYAQSSSFRPPANLSTAGVGLATWNLQSYVDASGLGPLVAANYFQVENGQATVTVPVTSAVVTSTLSTVTSPTASSGSMSGSASGTGSASRSGSASGSSASAATSSRAAASETKSRSFGLGLIVGAVGVVGCLVGAGLGL
ncbi:phosphatidylethanolamine-binding protein [Dioszegia hungarica]|uniref:Phosphatidylethanolamine-binding protein n=1 Tax=Dioszegia hungarica TaxID=4972 RepID=A0AA38LW14_9TREE|nr:phosphatidylethanolamine-binding protein [Dioszegia hungarica]KAI9636046.1 phosphatidylethanolamine-binding protein [Dioszegia hungarica]